MYSYECIVLVAATWRLLLQTVLFLVSAVYSCASLLNNSNKQQSATVWQGY